jgi:hypothetical protein
MDGPISERLTTSEFLEALTVTLANARLEGDPYKELAEKHLGHFETILGRIALQRRETQSAISVAQSELEVLENKTEGLLLKSADEIWEQLGQPDYDPIYNILFPATAPNTRELRVIAGRLLLMAQLLKNDIHPRIDAVQARRIAAEFDELAQQLHDKLDGLSKHLTAQNVLNELEAAVACGGLLELGALRRALRNLGLDDSRIKSVVPPPVSSRRFATR